MPPSLWLIWEAGTMKFQAMLMGGLFIPAQGLAADVTIGLPATYIAGDITISAEALAGFETELTQALCDTGGLSCTWVKMPREALLPALQAKEIDVMVGAFPLNGAYGDTIDTTAPYLYPDPFAFVVRQETAQLFGFVKTVAAMPDPAVAAWHATSAYDIKYFTSIEDTLDLVVTKEAEVAVVEMAALAPLMSAYEDQLKVFETRRLRPGLSMALHADNIDLRFTFEDLIYAMTEDGSLNTLTEKWFGIDAVKW